MNIFYNFEVDEDIFLNDKTLETNIYLDELKSFVKSRLQVLEQEINKEEATSTKMIVLVLPVNKETSNQGILLLGYSDNLIAKIEACITDNDIIYLQNRLSYIFNRLN